MRINDRGPFVGGRIIDLSREAAKQLGFYDKGVAQVRVRYIGPARWNGQGTASATPAPTRRRRPGPAASAAPRRPVRARGRTARRAPHAWRIQAGAFADRGNAERAAQRLADEGQASIEPVDRGGTTLWRVVVRGDSADAEDLRQRVSDAGFPGAKVIAAN